MAAPYKPPEVFKLPHSLPLLASPDINDSEIGGSYGTICVVSYDYLTILVTAKHTILDTIDGFHSVGRENPSLYIPILPEWNCEDIRKYNWYFISTKIDSDKYGKYDLAYAVLTSDQTDDIDIDRVRVMDDSSKYLGQSICGVLQGYPSRSNRNIRIRLNGFASPTSVGFNSVLDSYPYQKLTSPDFISFRYDHRTMVLHGQHYVEPQEKRPSMSGLSGSPLFCCLAENVAVENPVPVIGFFFEQNGAIAIATSSVVLIEHLLAHHRIELASSKPHRDFVV